MADITDLTNASQSSPDEAAKNIENATVFGMNPTGDKAFNSVLAPQAERALKPTDASPAVRDYMAQSTEHTAVATPDVPHLNMIDETSKRIGDFIHGRPNIDSQISDLSLKRMNDPENFSDADEGALYRLNQEREVSHSYKDIQDQPRDMFDYGSMGVHAVDHIADFLGAMGDAVSEAGSPTGRAISHTVPILGPGLALGYGMFESVRKKLTGDAYNTLSNQTEADGTPSNIDETTKKHLATGTGIVGAAIQTALPLAAGELLPAFSAAGVSANAALKTATMSIARQALIFGTTNGLTEATRIVNEEIGKTWDGTQASIVGGVVAAAKHIEEHFPRLAQSFGYGAAFGGVFGLAGEAIGAAAGANPDVPLQVEGAPSEPPGGAPPAAPRSKIDSLREFINKDPATMTENELKFREDAVKQVNEHDTAARASEAAAVSTLERKIEIGQEHVNKRAELLKNADPDSSVGKAMAGEQKLAQANLDKLKGQLGATKDFQATSEAARQQAAPDPKIQQAVKILNFKKSMIEINKAVEETGMDKRAPGQVGDFLSKAFERSGLKKVFTTLGELRDKIPGLSVDRLIKPVEAVQGLEHTPFEVDLHTVAEIAKENPEIWDGVTVEPNGPTAPQAKTRLEGVQTAVKERSDILERLGLKLEEPAPPAESPLKKPLDEVQLTHDDTEHLVRRADEILKALAPSTTAVVPYVDPELQKRKEEIEKELAEFKDEYENGIERESSLMDRSLEGQRKQIENLEYQVKTLRESGAVNMLPVYERDLKKAKEKYDKEGGNAIEAKFERLSSELIGINSKIESSSGVAGPSDEERTALQAELETIKSQIKDRFSKNHAVDMSADWDEPDSSKALGAYVHDTPTFTEAVRKALPQAKVQQIEITQQNARKAVADNLRDTATHEMTKVQDIQVEFAKEARLEEERLRIANDPNFEIVDKFRAAGKAARKAKVNSIYQIDPKTMTDEQIKKYANNSRLKEYQVFKKGASNIDEVASLLKVNGGDELLKILSSTPTREQVYRARANANAVEDENKARASVDLNHVRIVEAIQNEAQNNIEEIKFLLEQEWPGMKQGIKVIALPLPKIEELELKADDIVRKTPVGQLNAKKYEVGANRQFKVAIHAILKNELYAAVQAKEAEALNRLLYKKTLVAIAQYNRDLKFARKFQSKENQEIIKDAGPLISDAVKEILRLWNLKPSGNQPKDLPLGQADEVNGDFNKWVMRRAKEGRGDFSVPDYLTEIRQNIKDMTFEQFRVVIDRLRVLLKEAKSENRIQLSDAKAEKLQEEHDLSLFADELIHVLDEHVASDPKRLPPVQETIIGGFQKAKIAVATAEEQIAPKQNVYRELDHGQTAGKIFQVFDARMEGVLGSFGKEGFTYVKKINTWIDESIRKANEAHGNVDSFEKELIYIPEFEGVKELNHGENMVKKGLTKGDIACAWANMGQKYTKDMMFKTTGGVSPEVWQVVFDRILSVKDVVYVQTIVNLYKSPVIREKTRELQENQGREVHFIEGVPIMHRGVKYPGGYIRVRTVHDYTEAEAKRAQDFFEGKGAAYFNEEEGDKWSRHFAAESTDQGYLTSRTGNTESIDLSLHGLFTGLFEIAHDHAYREPLADFFKKIRAPGVRAAMVRAVGEQKVNTIISTNLEIAGRPTANEISYFRNPNRITKKILTRFGSRFSASVIWANMNAALKQFEAIPEMILALGPKSAAHFFHVNLMMMMNPEKIPSMIKLAAKIDPHLTKYIDNVNEETLNVLNELVPRKGKRTSKTIAELTARGVKYNVLSGKVDIVSKAYDITKIAGFYPHQAADIYTKVLQVYVVIKHVMAGDHPNYPKEKILAMTEKEQFEAIQAVAQQLSTITQIQNRHDLKAPIQKQLAMNWATFFWNYPRNILNNTILGVRKASWETKEGMDKIKSGLEKRKAEREAGGGGSDGGGGAPPTGGGDGSYGDDFRGAGKHFGTAAGGLLQLLAWRAVGGWFLLWIAGKEMNALDDDIKEIKWNDPGSVAKGGMRVAADLMTLGFMHGFIGVAPVIDAVDYAMEHKRKYGMSEVRDPMTQGLSSIATCLPAIKNLLTLTREPDRMQMRACLESGSYFSPITFPVRAYYQGIKFLDEHTLFNTPSNFHAQFTTAQVDSLHKDLKAFVKDPGQAPKEMVAEADHMAKQLSPDTVKVPAGASDAIKMAESHGLPGVNGLYGFTSGDWKSIMRQAPELGLTENGRTTKDSSQQEKAIDWSLHQDAVRLEDKDIPVNQHTLYGAHVLGFENYEKLFNASGDSKVKTVLGAEVLKAHPELQNFKTIGQVNSYINGKIDQGRKASEGDNKLTSPTANNED